MSSKIGITKSGIQEKCTVEAGQTCSRHKSHFDSSPIAIKEFTPILIEDPEVDSGLSLSDYNSFDRVEVKKALDNMIKIQTEMINGWQKTLDVFEETYNEGTKRLAASRNMTVPEYEKWLNNEDRDKGLWLKAASDENDSIVDAKWVSPYGEVVTIEADETGTTNFTHFIGDKPFKNTTVNKVYSSDDVDELESYLRDNFVN